MLKTYQNSFKLTSGTCLKHSTFVANEVCFQIPTFSILFTNGNLQESLYLKNTKFQAKSWQHCIQTYLICIAARRPPVEETTSFLNSLLASHGPNYLEKLFGSKARHRLRELGGVNQVAIALSGRYLWRHNVEFEKEVCHFTTKSKAQENSSISIMRTLKVFKIICFWGHEKWIVKFKKQERNYLASP